MYLFQGIVFILLATAAWNRLTLEDRGVVKAIIEILKPQAVLCATDFDLLLEGSSFIPNFLSYQWINSSQFYLLALGNVTPVVSTLVLAESHKVMEYLQIVAKSLESNIKPDTILFDSSYIWVVLESSYQINLNSFPISYDCEFYYIKTTSQKNEYDIIEKYDVYNYSKRILFGTYTPLNGLNYSSLDFYARRMNLKGATLKISRISEFDRSCIPLICMQREIWEGLAYMMNITSQPTIFNPDVYTGSTYSLHTGDIFLQMDNNLIRSLVGPIYVMRVYMHVKAKEKEIGGSSQFFKPFDRTTWAAIGTCLAISTAVYIIIHILTQQFEINHIFGPLALFCNQGNNTHCSDAAKLTSISTYFSTMVVVPIYSAALLSFIMVTFENLPFLTLEELSKKEGYTIAGIYERFAIHYLTVENQYSDLKFAVEMPQTIEIGLERLCSENKYVLLGYNNFLLMEKSNCRIAKIPGHLFSSTTSLKLSQRSPFKKIFNRNLIKYYTSGILNKWVNHVNKRDYINEDSEKGILQVELQHIYFIVYVGTMGLVSAFILFMIEHIIFFFRGRKIKLEEVYDQEVKEKGQLTSDYP